jgi:hypothetical protein
VRLGERPWVSPIERAYRRCGGGGRTGWPGGRPGAPGAGFGAGDPGGPGAPHGLAPHGLVGALLRQPHPLLPGPLQRPAEHSVPRARPRPLPEAGRGRRVYGALRRPPGRRHPGAPEGGRGTSGPLGFRGTYQRRGNAGGAVRGHGRWRVRPSLPARSAGVGGLRRGGAALGGVSQPRSL